MIIPKDMLESIKYFEHNTTKKNYEMFDVFVLHFKSFWKRSKTIKIRRVSRITGENNELITWSMDPGAEQLLDLLNQLMTETYDHDDMFSAKLKKNEEEKDEK